MNFRVVRKSAQAARLPLLDSKYGRSDQGGDLRRPPELQALQNRKAGVGGDTHLAENSRGDLLDPVIVLRAFEHFDKRSDGVATKSDESLMGFRDGSGVAARELGDPIPGF
jgi:hypothetical protein